MVKLQFSKGSGDKKYRVIIFDNKDKKIKTVQFGNDTPLKLYKNLDHLDKSRRDLYYKRHKKNYPKYSADYFSKRFLWSKK